MIIVWKCLKNPPLLERTVFGRHSFKTTRGLYSPSYTAVTHCNTDTPATHIRAQFSFQYDSYNSSTVHWTVVEMDRVSFRRSVSFMKRDGMVAGCIFILLHSHGASWTRLKKRAVKMTTNLNIVCTGTLRHNAGISYWPSTYKISIVMLNYSVLLSGLHI